VCVRLGIEAARDLLARSALKGWAFGAAVVVVLAGLHERTSDGRGADHTLLGLTLPLVVPIACDAVFECAYGGAKSSALVAPFARHGADGRSVAFGVDVVVVAVCAALTAGLSALSVLAASAVPTGALADADACIWGGALIGGAYAGLLTLGSTWGRAGRLWLLFGDWLFGSGTGAAALPWVRGHARSLLGGEAVLRTSPVLATVALVLLASSYVLASARRGPR
jgi:hypothetical protein